MNSSQAPLRVRFHRFLSALVCLGAGLALPVASQVNLENLANQAISDPARTVVRMADANGDGATSGEEWVAFLDGLTLDAEGELEPYSFKALVVGLDASGAVTRADVERALSADSGRPRDFLTALVETLADTDTSGDLTDAEREAFLGAVPDVLDAATLADWLRRAETIPPADVNAMTPGVVLLTLDSAFDTNGDARITLVDLNALHRGLDANGDSDVEAAELRAGRQGGSFGDWRVTSSMRERPPVMPWQRSLEDALLLAERTGKPLLLCVNVDGENASENLAWGRYRDPAFAELASGFVCLLASPDRHSTFDRDDRGVRLTDPRFGRLIDPEHIDIEPALYERWFSGRRVAPRHVAVRPRSSSDAVEADGGADEVLFDLFLLQDLSIVDKALAKHGVRDATPPADPGTLTVELLFDSPDALHRTELERRFVVAAEPERVALASAALSDKRVVQHPELVRLALRDPSPAVQAAALACLVAHPAALPVDVIPAAFARSAGDPARSLALLEALRRAAALAEEGTPRGDALAFHVRVRDGLAIGSQSVDVERWRLLLAASPTWVPDVVTAADEEAVLAVLPRLERALDAAKDSGQSAAWRAELWVALAAARMRAGEVQLALGGNPTFFFEDANVAARNALALAPADEAGDGRALGIAARSSWLRNRPAEAADLAAAALPALLRDASTPLAFEVLKVFASVRTSAIYAAMGAAERADQAFDPALVADAVAAREVLAAHPGSTEADWITSLQLLGNLAAFGEQADLLRRALLAHPGSTDLQNWLRFQVLRDAGSRALEDVYDGAALSAARVSQGAAWTWFHGLATLYAAEHDVQARDTLAARGAYRRCVERFEEATASQPEYAASSAYYEAQALAGLARLLAADGELVQAQEALLASLALAPESAETADNLGVTPFASARDLVRSLRDAGAVALADELTERLAELGLEL